MSKALGSTSVLEKISLHLSAVGTSVRSVSHIVPPVLPSPLLLFLALVFPQLSKCELAYLLSTAELSFLLPLCLNPAYASWVL